MSELRGWKNVPPGSVLNINVTNEGGGAAPFVAEARLVGDDGQLPAVNDAQLNPGPAQINFAGGTQFDGRLWIQFAQAGTAEVVLQMFKPDGSDHGKKTTYSIPGQQNERVRVTLVILMEGGN